MPQPQSGRAVANESKCLFIVELFVDAGELSVELNHRMMDFHRSRKIQIQHGRRVAASIAKLPELCRVPNRSTLVFREDCR